MLSVSITGVKETVAAVGTIKRNAARTLEDVLSQMGDMILKKALVYVPRKTGALAASGRKELRQGGYRGRVELDVSFGRTNSGTTLPYARRVHEDPEIPHAPPTTYKYLSRAVRETAGARQSLIKRVLGIGVRGL